MPKKLTAGVLNGAAFKETMGLEWNGEEFEVEIKALTNTEATDVEALMQKGVNVKAKPSVNGKMSRSMDFDYDANFRGRKEANILAVAYGTTDESITKEVVEKEFPPKLVEEIADRVKQISGIENQKEVEDFQEGKESPSDSSGEQ